MSKRTKGEADKGKGVTHVVSGEHTSHLLSDAVDSRRKRSGGYKEQPVTHLFSETGIGDLNSKEHKSHLFSDLHLLNDDEGKKRKGKKSNAEGLLSYALGR